MTRINASIASAQLGNGLSLSQTWTDGRLASKRLYTTATGANLSWLAYVYDSDDNIGAVRDQLDDANSAYYGYDGNDRLSFASMTVGTPATGTETYSYTSGKNRLASITNASGTRSIGYDNRGNTVSETRPGGGSVSASYDGYGRLLTYARTGDPAQANVYNGLDDRVSVTSGSVTHAFVYDPDGRLIGEYGTSASDVVAETIWLSPEVSDGGGPIGGDDGVGGYTPLALVTGSGASAALYWVHGNHLGVPLVTTDASGAVASPSGYTPVGFPGQTKTLSDLYYNRYRDYDSSLGRYIQADPIGLQGGDNPYLYAEANPLKYVDPSGKLPFLVIPGICAAGGCEALGALALSLGVATYNWYKNAPPMPQAVPPSVPRPQGMTPNQESLYDRYCKGEGDPCSALKAEIARRIEREHGKRFAIRLHGQRRYSSHADNLRRELNVIAVMISLGKLMGCDMTKEERMFSILVALGVPGPP